MPTELTLWELQEDGSVVQVNEASLSAESQIEDAIESAPELLGTKVLIVGRQVSVPNRGIGRGLLDQLALNEEGRLVVIENKRDRTPRDVVAQVVDYAAWANTTTLSEIEELYDEYALKVLGDGASSLADAYQEHFEMEGSTDDIQEHLAIGIEQKHPQMVVVASRLDDSTERMLDFLAGAFGVPINALLFQPFEHPQSTDRRLIGRTWLRPEEPKFLHATESKSTASNERKEQAKRTRQAFWDRWLQIARPKLKELKLPKTSVWSYIAHTIDSDCPARFSVWVTKKAAYAQVRFENQDPALNEAFLAAMQQNRIQVEAAFGDSLEWKNEPGVRATIINTPKVQIGDMADPKPESLEQLVDCTRRIYDAIKDEIPRVFEQVTKETRIDGEDESREDVSSGYDGDDQDD